MANLITTAIAMAGGLNAVTGAGQEDTLTVGGVWVTTGTENYSIILTDTISGVQTLVGFGNITGATPSYALTFNKKVYFLFNSSVAFSAINQPTVFDSLTVSGNGFVDMSNQYNTPEPLVAMATYQGRLAFFARQNTQIWSVDADPTKWALQQTLNNIGARAKESVKSIGDLDVLFLSDTGFRSLRVHDISLNAYVSDIGTPVDQLVQDAMLSVASSVVEAACGVVEPTANRYWCFLKDTIYVLSYFPSNKIVAWSTYAPTYDDGSGNQVAFTPSRFVVFQGQVWGRDTTAIYLYGGTDNNTYDACQATVTLPFLDSKTPATIKESRGIEIAMQGEWVVNGCMDIYGQQYTQISDDSQASFDKGMVPWTSSGTHFSLQATTKSVSRAVISSLIWHYNLGTEK